MNGGQRVLALIATAFLGGTATVAALGMTGALKGPFLLLLAASSLAALVAVQALASRSRKRDIRDNGPTHDPKPGDHH
ncbi:hypothetical protein GCM10007148_22200 [Parvularcula lutaonensis]|nr:hypothetical protein GCM10007148_22200 [Parvularcula lutaonensis]